MFQNKEIERYKNLKAPQGLKNRTFFSIERTERRRTKQRVGWVAAVATLVMVFFAGGIVERNDSILFVNDIAVTYDTVSLESSNRGIDVVKIGSKQDAHITVPLEVNVTENAQISVTTGTLWRTSQEEAENITELTVSEKTVIYWTLNGNANITPICSITVGKETEQYMIFLDEESAVYYIKKIK